MYTPEEITISHPTFFNKCLLSKPPLQNTVPCRKRENKLDAYSTSIISYIHSSLPIAGTLTENSKGFIYLDIDDRYITSIIPFFNDPAIDIPPYFCDEFNQGAHIAVASSYEEKKLFTPLPIGDAFSFTITGCFKASLLFDIENKLVWYLTIEAKQLQELRTSLGLQPLPNNETFYITIAYKKTFLSLQDLLTEASKHRITLSEDAILLNKLKKNNENN